MSSDSKDTNTFLTMEEMNSPQHRAILELASQKAGFTSYDTFTTWLASPAIAPFWTEFERDFLKPLITSRKSSSSSSSSSTTPDSSAVPPGASDIPYATYTLVPLFQGLFGTKDNLCKDPTKEKWKPNHHMAWFFLKVWERNHEEMRSSPWAGCYLENVRMWAMQLCWVLDSMTRCKYQEELGVHVVEFKGQRDEGCVITYKF